MFNTVILQLTQFNLTSLFSRPFVALYLCLMQVFSFGQTGNCPVVAKMLPEGDTVLQARATILYQNASTNATDYRFIVDGISYSLNQPANIGVGVGLRKVQLVAYQGNCSDTAVTYVFYAGQFPSDTNVIIRNIGQVSRELEMKGICRIKNDGIVLYGNRQYNFFMGENQTGILIKAKTAGCVEWARRISAPSSALSSITAAEQSPDGHIFTLSELSSNVGGLLSRINATGNLIWAINMADQERYKHYFHSLKTTPDGGAITVSRTAGFSVIYFTRFNRNGEIVWQKKMDAEDASFNHFGNLLIKDGCLYAAGYQNFLSNNGSAALLIKMNADNGQTIWTKRYTTGTSNISFSDLTDNNTGLTACIRVPANNSLRPVIGGIMNMDTSGNVSEARIITEIHVPDPVRGSFAASTSRLVRSGQSYYIITAGAYPLNLQGDGRTTKQIRLDTSLQVRWVISNGGVNQPRYYFNAAGNHDGAIIGGTHWAPGLAPFPFGIMYQVVNIDSSGTLPDNQCYFRQQEWDSFTPVISTAPFEWRIDTPTQNRTGNPPVDWQPYYPEMRYTCTDYVDSCSYLKISGPSGVCNLASAYVYRSHKNKACGQPTQWSVSPGVQILSQSDTALRVKFLNHGQHTIWAGNLLSCVPVEDSMRVIAASSTPPLNLGKDTAICPGNSLDLRPGHYFTRYEWQDGATDSVRTVRQPGLYWLKATDSCDNIWTDTIRVNQADPIPISAGANRIICLDDTVHLSATPGFLQYQWQPDYQANTTTGATIIVSPRTDTFYTVTGEKPAGCFSVDTVRINVKKAAPVDLGNDTSLCRGDSLLLNAGSGYQTYTWNTGATSSSIVVRAAGNYSVKVTIPPGCTATDTLTIIRLIDLPAPQLDKNPVLCSGDKRVLDAGNGFREYLWNTGATTPQIVADQTGIYAVTVTDNNGCKGYDTARILSAKNIPAFFLPADTAVCLYQQLTISPRSAFQNYLWSNANRSPALTITEPGIFWLQVTDTAGCVGKDSIEVKLKQDCFRGVYAPSAFTPNGDGRNDVFKPVVYGHVKYYFFQVYNRWGKAVFTASDPRQGWDGKLNGKDQDGSVYTWTLRYQLENQLPRETRGTILLLR